jgi:hypothetical protein
VKSNTRYDIIHRYLLRFGEVAFYLGYNAMKNFFPMTQVQHAHTPCHAAASLLSAKSESDLLERVVCEAAGAVRRVVRQTGPARIPFRFSFVCLLNVCRIRPNTSMQPVARPVAAAPQVAVAVANEWGIVLEDSSVDDPSAASGGAALPEGLFYAFERAAQPAPSSQSLGGASAGATESVDDLMAQLQCDRQAKSKCSKIINLPKLEPVFCNFGDSDAGLDVWSGGLSQPANGVNITFETQRWLPQLEKSHMRRPGTGDEEIIEQKKSKQH